MMLLFIIGKKKSKEYVRCQQKKYRPIAIDRVLDSSNMDDDLAFLILPYIENNDPPIELYQFDPELNKYTIIATDIHHGVDEIYVDEENENNDINIEIENMEDRNDENKENGEDKRENIPKDEINN